ncbi:MAG: hypothetical protein J5554_08520 [Paludibacteraceae bacterium]|nr:hypothetical protein [Paludibacteraceae bacterium]
MKDFVGLWDRQEVEKPKLDAIRRDWSEGKVPELPYLVIGQTNAKEHIGKKLSKIDGIRMETTVIQAQYGDGKTNILKYLELYFKKHAELNIKMVYCRANPEQIDLCTFLMQHLEASCLTELVEQIVRLKSDPSFNYANLANDFNDDFSLIREYTDKLFDKNLSDDDIRSLIFLGTGRLYSKGSFAKYNLQKITDFNRREVFVLFMNILALRGVYLLFAIDELEKINDKSNKRMAHFFTSYRELLDLFNKIKGHYLISAITNGVDVQALCQPLYERLDKDIITIEKIKTENELSDLIKLLSDLLSIKINDDKKQDIVGKLSRNQKLINNRRTIQFAAELIRNTEFKEEQSIEDVLKSDRDLKDLYEETKVQLESQSAFSNLSRVIFDPLKYYLESLGYNDVDKNLLRRDYQSFIDESTKKAYFFLFNDNLKIQSRIEDFVENKGIHNFVIFVPYEMSLSYSDFSLESNSIQIIEYNPAQLFILLNMYKWNIDKQTEIFKLIGIATKFVFE